MTEPQSPAEEGQDAAGLAAHPDRPVTVSPAHKVGGSARVSHPAPETGVAEVFHEITSVEDEVFHLVEHTLVDTLHLTGRVATVAVSETSHVLGSAVRGVMHILTRALPKGSDLRQAYTMAEVAEEVLPEVERILPLL